MASAPTTATTPTDNNIAGTQAANASFEASNPNVFGTPTPSSTTPAPLGNTIGSQNLSSTQQIQLPPPVQSPDGTPGLLGAAQQTSKSVQDYINALTPAQPTAADNAQQSLLNSISTLTGEDTGKDQALLNAEQQTGAIQDQQDLTNLNNSLLAKTASYNQQFANLGGNNSVETSAVLNAQTAGLKKAQAADIGLTTAQIQAKQGDLNLALQTAQNAVNAKYSTIEDNIKTQQAQLAALQPMLDKEQKIQADAQQAYLQEQQQNAQNLKDAETQINNVALQAASAGASSDLINQIQNSPDVVSAIATAAPALGAAALQKIQQQQFDNNIALQQLLISKQQANTSAASVGIEQQKLDLQKQQLLALTSPAAMINQAQQFQATGKISDPTNYGPYEGAIASIAASLPKTPGMIYNATTGVAPTNMDAKSQENIQALYSIVNTVLPNLTSDFNAKGVEFGLGPNAAVTQKTYANDVATLNAALTTLSKAGFITEPATNLPTSISIFNHSSTAKSISDLTDKLSTQLQSYLNNNNLSIAGFSDQNNLETNGGLDSLYNSTIGAK